MAPPAPDSENGDSGNNSDGDDDEVELVQRAPDQDDDTATSSSSNAQTMACRSIQGKYGERTLKNPGVILRYQYELIQDTNDIDYTYLSSGNDGMEVRDGTEYLIENIVPSFEQGVGDVLVNALFEECGGGMRRKKKERRLLRFGTKKENNEHGLEGWRELKSSTVVGLDGEPEDFPLGQGGECLLLVWVDVVSIAFSQNKLTLSIANIIYRMYINLQTSQSPPKLPMSHNGRCRHSLLPTELLLSHRTNGRHTSDITCH